MRAHARKSWTQSYDPALKAVRGSRLLAVKEDSKWPGWFWCSDEAGLSGWLPLQAFGKVTIGRWNRLVSDFDSVELSVTAGEILEVLERLNGWSRCRNPAKQEGWLPDNCLEFCD